MDPNATLRDLRDLVREESLDGDWAAETAAERCAQYAELLTALDEWLSKGGFLPAAWVRPEADQ